MWWNAQKTSEYKVTYKHLFNSDSQVSVPGFVPNPSWSGTIRYTRIVLIVMKKGATFSWYWLLFMINAPQNKQLQLSSMHSLWEKYNKIVVLTTINILSKTRHFQSDAAFDYGLGETNYIYQGKFIDVFSLCESNDWVIDTLNIVLKLGV